MNHNSPETHSSQFVKSILFNTSTGVYNGRTVVNENAQKITAHQTNKNLLLSKDFIILNRQREPPPISET